jgi:dTDP-4-amino-4,6-dideoxygalactose transaminase
VEGFERDFASWCGAEHAVGVSSGTEALALALRALEVGAGDEVIVPSNSFIATAEAVSATGATPVLVDVDPDTALLSAAIAEQAITPRTRCVIPVHLYGRTVDMDPLLAVAQRAGIAVLEDACQAHGAVYRGRRAGSMGHAGCFSFYPTKNLGAWGDAGAVITNSPQIDQRVRLLRSHGELTRYQHQVIGSTARMDGLQAAVLRHKLTLLEEWNEQRRRAGAILRTAPHCRAYRASPYPPPPRRGATTSTTCS